MAGYGTPLASEFYVLSMLHRLGADASLTLANKKSVDISVLLGAGNAITVDVRGLAKRNHWPMRIMNVSLPNRHYFALLCFNGNMRGPSALPDVWIVPSKEIGRFVKPYMNGAMEVVSYAAIRDDGRVYKDAWAHLGCETGS